MLSTMQEKQPIALTGILKHCYLWVTSGTENIVYKNPFFNAEKAGKNAFQIYCSHGTADRTNAYKLILERLSVDLHEYCESIILVAQDDRFTGIGNQPLAEQLLTIIDSRENKEIVNVGVVGHSRGCIKSVIFSEYLAQLIGVNVIFGLFIAGPFGGSPLATWPLSYFSDSIKEMGVDSVLLKTLREKMATSKIPYFYFAAGKDSLVPLTSSYIPEHLDRLYLFPKHGHLSIMSSHQLVGAFKKIIYSMFNEEKLVIEIGDESPEENLLEMDNEFKHILELDNALAHACEEINDYIATLNGRYHLWTAQYKIKLLETLQTKLKAMCEGDRGEDYNKAETIGDFIMAFCQDESINNGIKPIVTLNEPLNWPCNFFSGQNSETQNFLVMLASKYFNIYLPKRKYEDDNKIILNI